MVDKRILDYLNKYRGKYPLGALRQKIISSGYSAKEVDVAINFLGLRKTPAKPVAPKLAIQKKSQVISAVKVASKIQPTTIQPKVTQPKVTPHSFKKGVDVKKSSKGKFSWMKISGIFGFVILFILIFQIASNMLIAMGVSLSFLNSMILGIALTSVNLISFLLFYFGFVKLGKHVGSKLLRISSWVIIALEIVFIAFVIIISLVVGNVESVTNFNEGSNLLWLILSFILFLGIAVSYILFSISLIKIGGKVKFAKLAGLLNLFSVIIGLLIFGGLIIASLINALFVASLMSGLWVLILISGLLSLAGLSTILFESLCLLNASKQFE